MENYSKLANLTGDQLLLINDYYGITAGELAFLLEFHDRYKKVSKPLLDRLYKN